MSDEVKQVLVSKQDLQFEEDIVRNPFYLKNWLNYLTFKEDSPPSVRFIIYERALKHLPRSFKLWHAYLVERRDILKHKSIADKRYSILINTYERALVHLHKMPRIWIDYCTILIKTRKGTPARKAFDRALQSLPITQHDDIWKLYISWAKSFGVADTTVRIFRRYIMYNSNEREDFVTYLEEIGQFEEAARQLAICVNDDHYFSPSGQTRHQMWMHLCDLCANHPEETSRCLKVEAIIRSGIARFSDEIGRLWCRLADYYTRLGLFEKARDIYDEAINSVTTVRDFTVVFDSYAKFEESVLSAKMKLLQRKDANDGDEEEDEDDDEEVDEAELSADIEMRLARLEYLMDRRPLLLNSVVLRQNPHNVHEWHKRVKLVKHDPQRALMTYTEAVKSVDPQKSVGRLSSLWMAFAKFYESKDDLPNARVIFSKAVEVPIKNVEELASVWCAWAEMEIRHENYEEALAVMQQAVTVPASAIQRRRMRAAEEGIGGKSSDSRGDGADQGLSSVDRVHRSVKVWGLYLDLEESLGTVDTCRAAYDRAIELKIVTPLMILNYAAYLEERNFFEDSFRVYERGVAMFDFPHVKKIWLVYLDKFIARYSGKKIERLRDLFEQAVAKVPKEDAIEFYIKYAKVEEEFGLARHAMAVYDRATRAVPEARRLDMYRLYIKRVEHHYGITKTRPVYERAITELNDEMSCKMCLDFADMERKLGEIDRARAILRHGCQFADPRRDRDLSYWSRWKEFEEAHGNEDTFREMLRIKRSVEVAFSQVNYLAAEMLAASSSSADDKADASQSIGDSENEDFSKKRKFVAASETSNPSGAADGDLNTDRSSKVRKALNPDDIDIDENVEGAGDDEDGFQVSQVTIPAAVFGSITVPDESSHSVDAKPKGALERFQSGMQVEAR